MINIHFDQVRLHNAQKWPFLEYVFNQVFNENRVIVSLKSAGGRSGGRAGGRSGGRASTFGFRSITLVCCGLLTPNLLYG